MATRAEQFRTEEQRRASRAQSRPAARKKTTRAASAATKPAKVPSHATYAFEAPTADGRRSRKSTRASANRAKPDTNFNLRESMVKGSPEARYGKARAKTTRVRGSKV